ncbi:MAG: hypothetical protein L6V90_07600 [Treponema succinifaciens]|nr:MAG: hypothetical protein L6V90_07600 [Treponema succinifaciens]
MKKTASNWTLFIREKGWIYLGEEDGKKFDALLWTKKIGDKKILRSVCVPEKKEKNNSSFFLYKNDQLTGVFYR